MSSNTTSFVFSGTTAQQIDAIILVKQNYGNQIIPRLKAFIAENSQSLLSEAIAKVKARLAEEVAETRRELEQLEKQIATAKF